MTANIEPAPRLIEILAELGLPAQAPAPRSVSEGPVRVRRRTPIAEGTRDNTLFSIAVALVHEGATGPVLVEALLDANQRLCPRPLPEADVRRIATSAIRGPR